MQRQVPTFPKTNNIDLLRLFAATQVVVFHMAEHLHHASRLESTALMALSYFPGVPIFFFLSGLLIPQSFLRAPGIKDYVTNRVLRLYPALLVCVSLTVVMLIALGYLGTTDLFRPELLVWLATQSTFLQFYNPDLFRDFGTGVVNGSLWTISVEVQFYLMTPVLIFLINFRFIYLALFLLSIAANVALQHFGMKQFFWGKLVGVSFLPWIYMFMGGHLSYAYWDKISRFFEGKSAYWFVLALAQTVLLMILEKTFGVNFSGNATLPITFFILAGLALAVAMGRPNTAYKILKGNDISYGVYIYHMPIVNLFLFLSVPSSLWYTLGAITIVFALAYFSWVLVERPALRLKHVSIRPR